MKRGGIAGFTLTEVLLVILLGSVLMSIALPRIARAHGERQVVNARDSLLWMGALARSTAVSRGGVVRLEIRPATSQALIIVGRPGADQDTLEVTDYLGRYGTLVETSVGDAVVCYGARGFVQGGCGTFASTTDPIEVRFARDGLGVAARIRPLGQVDRLW